MKPQTSPHPASRPTRAPRAAILAAPCPASSLLFLIAPILLVVSLGLSLAIILPR